MGATIYVKSKILKDTPETVDLREPSKDEKIYKTNDNVLVDLIIEPDDCFQHSISTFKK